MQKNEQMPRIQELKEKRQQTCAYMVLMAYGKENKKKKKKNYTKHRKNRIAQETKHNRKCKTCGSMFDGKQNYTTIAQTNQHAKRNGKKNTTC